MAKNIRAGGFPELTPDKQILEDNIKQIIAENYKKSGFVNIETPSVELSSVLTAKGGDEVAKQIFGLYGLAQGAQDAKNYSLHFDLTVPFARYVIEHEDELKFPFKRSQIQKVFRWERQQKGRYKEFTQCDIDIIWDKLSINYDIEVIGTLASSIADIFSFLNINKKSVVHINNKHFIEAMFEMFKITWENKANFFKLLDDYYKLPKEKFESLLEDIVWNKKNDVLKFLKKDLSIENIKTKNKTIINWVSDLEKILETLKNRWIKVVFDPYITRWLDYYTWVVFETFIEDNFEFWSVCSGGRYDNLVWAIRDVTWAKWKSFEWVWGSIGLSRLFYRLEDAWLINKELPLSDIILFNMGASDSYRESIIKGLKKTPYNVDVYYNEAKLEKQFKYAESKNIPFWIFAWENEEKENQIIIKNLEKRTQKIIKVNDLEKYLK